MLVTPSSLFAETSTSFIPAAAAALPFLLALLVRGIRSFARKAVGNNADRCCDRAILLEKRRSLLPRTKKIDVILTLDDEKERILLSRTNKNDIAIPPSVWSRWWARSCRPASSAPAQRTVRPGDPRSSGRKNGGGKSVNIHARCRVRFLRRAFPLSNAASV